MTGGIIISATANFQEVFGLYMSTYFWEFKDGDIARLSLLLGLATFLLFWGSLAIVPVTGLGILLSSMFKGIIDENELKTGLH